MNNNYKENTQLTDAELLGISGGAAARGRSGGADAKPNIIRIACSSCGNPFYADINKAGCNCPVCRYPNVFSG